MRYSVAHHSLPGTRQTNEDRVAVAERDGMVLMVVADGLGGYHGGELAADTLTETMVNSFERAREPSLRDPASFLVLSMSFAHTMINKRAKENDIKIELPRTTCVACLVRNGLAYWAHVGDSRLYYVRDKQMVFHTTDHSTSMWMLEEGVVKDKVFANQGGRLMRCIGGVRRHEVTLGPETQLDTGDTLLLCTDGVWRALQERHLRRLAEIRKLEHGVVDLLTQVERRSHEDCDNISAILFRWEDEPSTVDPLYGLTVPNIDQKVLWSKTTTGAGTAGPKSRKRKGKRTKQIQRGEIQSTIDELESFVTKLDGLLEDS